MTTTDTTMTEPADTEAPDEHLEVQAPQAEPAPEAAGADEHEGGKANREAARYRTQLRDTEARLETLTAQHDALVRSVIESQLPQNVPAAVFWKFQDGVDGLLTETGTVDSGAVQSRAADVFTEAGLLPARTGPIVPRAGEHPTQGSPGPTWHDVVTNRVAQ